MLASLEYAKPLQHDDELDRLIEIFRREHVVKYLEIGARYGGTFERVMSSLPPDSVGIAVDLPGGPFGDPNSPAILSATIRRLGHWGQNVRVLYGSSSNPMIVNRVRDMAPFGAVLIDADHAYNAVALDFSIYSPLARIVVLHDIAAPAHVRSRTGLTVEVPRFWREIKGRYRHEEIVTENSLMGIGVLWMDPKE